MRNVSRETTQSPVADAASATPLDEANSADQPHLTHWPANRATDSEDLEFSWAKYAITSCEQLIIVFGFYILSIGPMYWKWLPAKYADDNSFVKIFYEPLWRLSDAIPALGDIVNWYVSWWIL